MFSIETGDEQAKLFRTVITISATFPVPLERRVQLGKIEVALERRGSGKSHSQSPTRSTGTAWRFSTCARVVSNSVLLSTSWSLPTRSPS
jgi:hypothetical protein